MILKIALGVFLWTAISIWWFIANMGQKTGGNCWYDWFLAPPVLLIALVWGKVSHALAKPEHPIVTSGLAVQNNPPKKYCTQVRFTGDKGRYWYINVFSDTEQLHEVHGDEVDFK